MKKIIFVLVFVLVSVSVCFGQRNRDYEDGSIYSGTVPITDTTGQWSNSFTEEEQAEYDARWNAIQESVANGTWNSNDEYWSDGVRKHTPEEQAQYDEYWSWGVKKNTPEEQERINAEIDNRNNSNNSSFSYSILGTKTSAHELIQAGYQKVGDDTWMTNYTDAVDGYIWLDNYVVKSEGFVFRDTNPYLTHDDIADLLINSFEHGHIKVETKCVNGYSGEKICRDLIDVVDILYGSFPVTVFKTDTHLISCYLTTSAVFSNGKKEEYFYICSLGI